MPTNPCHDSPFDTQIAVPQCFGEEKTASGQEAVYMLFLSEEYLYRASEEVEVRTELVLQEALVRIADVLR